MWLTCGHTSHNGVGRVIEFYTNLVLDCTVRTFFLSLMQPRAERNTQITMSARKITNARKIPTPASGAWKLKLPFSIPGTHLVRLARDIRLYSLRRRQPYITDTVRMRCRASYTSSKNIYSREKIMGTNLYALLAKSKKGESLGGRAGLTEGLIQKLANFYGLALWNSSEVNHVH